MKNFLRLYTIGLSLILPLLAGAMQSYQLPVPEVETLSNGLRVVWFVSDRFPMVNLEMVFRSGTRDDPPGKSGTAELVAATMDRGAGKLTERQIAEKVESLGASRSISADDDFFRVDLHGLALDSEELLDLLAKLVRTPTFAPDEVKKEQTRMLDGWSRLADYGESLVDLAYRRALTQNTVYARGGLLSSHEFARLGSQDLRTFQVTHLTPNNATLLVVGRVKREKFRSQIVSLFGDWKGAAPHRLRRNYISLKTLPKKGQVLLMDRPDLTQAQVRLGFRAPSIHDQRHYSLTVANALLGEYFHSRLNTLIRDQLGLTYGIGSSFSYNQDLAMFSISAATRNESVGQMIQKTVAVLQAMKSGPISQEEVETAKEYLVGGFPLSTATLESVAGSWMTSDLFALGPNRLNEFVPKITAVQLADVSRSVLESFDLDHLIIAVAGDAKTLEPVLKKAGYQVLLVPVVGLLDGQF